MSLGEAILRVLGFRPIVKIPGKDLTSLSLPEVALMIDNHLSLHRGYPEGVHGDAFDRDALFDFLEYPNPNPNADLELARKQLVAIDEKYRTPEQPDGFAFEEAQPELTMLRDRLRRGEL